MFTRRTTRNRDNKAHHKTPPAADAHHRKHQSDHIVHTTLDRLFIIIASFPAATNAPSEGPTLKLVNLIIEAQARYQNNGVLEMPPATTLESLLRQGADPNCRCPLQGTPMLCHLVYLLAFCRAAPDGGRSVIDALVVFAQAGAVFTTQDIRQMAGALRIAYPFNGTMEEERARQRASALEQSWQETSTDFGETKTRL